MSTANLIIIAYEFTQTWLNCVNFRARIDSRSVVSKVSDLARTMSKIYTI